MDFPPISSVLPCIFGPMWFGILLVVLMLVWLFRSPWIAGLHVPRWALVSLFIIKCAAGLLLSEYYLHHSGLDRHDIDILKYFDDGEVMASAWSESKATFRQLFLDKDGPHTQGYYEAMNNWERAYDLIQVNDNRSMIRIHGLLHLMSGGRFWVHLLFFVMASFIGTLLIVHSVKDWAGLKSWWVLPLALLMPSLLAWTSAPLKEAWVMFPIGLCTYGLVSLRKGKGWIPLCFGMIMLIGIKPYLAVAFSTTAFLILCSTLTPFSVSTAFWVVQSGALALLGLMRWSPKTDIIGVLSLKQRDFYNVAAEKGAASLITIPPFDDWWTFLLAVPVALWNGLTRPYLWEAHNGVAWLSALEQIILVLFIVTSVLMRRKHIRWDVALPLLSMVVWTFIFVGVTTPVLGAAVRYRSPALLFLILVLLCIIDVKRWRFWRREATS